MNDKSQHPLALWLAERGLKKVWFYENAGISENAFLRVFSGRPISAQTAHKIVEATGGDVDYNAIFDPYGERIRAFS